jgi:hypothetical protein
MERHEILKPEYASWTEQNCCPFCGDVRCCGFSGFPCDVNGGRNGKTHVFVLAICRTRITEPRKVSQPVSFTEEAPVSCSSLRRLLYLASALSCLLSVLIPDWTYLQVTEGYIGPSSPVASLVGMVILNVCGFCGAMYCFALYFAQRRLDLGEATPLRYPSRDAVLKFAVVVLLLVCIIRVVDWHSLVQCVLDVAHRR